MIRTALDKYLNSEIWEHDLPSEASVKTAEKIYKWLEENGFLPEIIAPLTIGGVYFRFTGNQRYAAIEVDNDAEVLFITKIKGEPSDVWKLEQWSELPKSFKSVEIFLEA